VFLERQPNYFSLFILIACIIFFLSVLLRKPTHMSLMPLAYGLYEIIVGSTKASSLPLFSSKSPQPLHFHSSCSLFLTISLTFSFLSLSSLLLSSLSLPHTPTRSRVLPSQPPPSEAKHRTTPSRLAPLQPSAPPINTTMEDIPSSSTQPPP
jgi:hypothetical protein